MGLNIRPAFRIIANERDITDKIRTRFRSLRLTDETGDVSDTLEITLADHESADPIRLPSTGAELDVAIGYDGSARQMGRFVVDEIELSGYPQEMTIRARAAPFEQSTGGMVGLQSQKSRSWKAGTTLGDLVRRIAGEHRLQPAIAGALASIRLPHTDQSSESDMNLIHRLARRYDAVAKAAGGRLVVMPRGTASTVSGREMPRVPLTPADCSSYRVTIASRDDAGTCVAYYRDVRGGQRHEVKVGSGDPVQRLRFAYRDAASAAEAARSALRRRRRATRTLSCTMPGRPEVVAESLVTLAGFRDGVDGEWLVTRAEHYIGPQGYRLTIDAELPNADGDVREVDAADVEDVEQAATEV